LVLFDRHFNPEDDTRDDAMLAHSVSTCVITGQLITLPLLFVLFLFVLGFVCGWFVSCSASLFGVWFFLLAS
jgi:hypothetical protein